MLMPFMMLMQMMLGLLVLHTMNLLVYISLLKKSGFVAADDTMVGLMIQIQRMMSMKMMLLLFGFAENEHAGLHVAADDLAMMLLININWWARQIARVCWLRRTGC